MNLQTEIFGEVVVLHAPEELGAEQREAFVNYVSSLDRHKVVLDLGPAETIDSQGLEALLDAQDTLRGRGGDMKVAAVNGVNRKILEITRLDQQIEVFDSVIEAVKSFQ